MVTEDFNYSYPGDPGIPRDSFCRRQDLRKGREGKDLIKYTGRSQKHSFESGIPPLSRQKERRSAFNSFCFHERTPRTPKENEPLLLLRCPSSLPTAPLPLLAPLRNPHRWEESVTPKWLLQAPLRLLHTPPSPPLYSPPPPPPSPRRLSPRRPLSSRRQREHSPSPFGGSAAESRFHRECFCDLPLSTYCPRVRPLTTTLYHGTV